MQLPIQYGDPWPEQLTGELKKTSFFHDLMGINIERGHVLLSRSICHFLSSNLSSSAGCFNALN